MPRYVVFFRALNVGGRVVKMEALREMLAMPGFKNIKTYIQSGNAAFDHAGAEKSVIINKLENKLQKELGYEVKSLVYTKEELQAIIDNNPFQEIDEDVSLYVTFLAHTPDKVLAAELLAMQTPQEQFRISGAELYITVKKGTYGETKFSNNFIERKLKLAATTRNWATTNKMMEL